MSWFLVTKILQGVVVTIVSLDAEVRVLGKKAELLFIWRILRKKKLKRAPQRKRDSPTDN
jgi:hypothetical protein